MNNFLVRRGTIKTIFFGTMDTRGMLGMGDATEIHPQSLAGIKPSHQNKLKGSK